MDDNLCCPECDHSMSEEEWDKLQDDDGFITCPSCGEEIDFEDLLTETEEDESREDDDEPEEGVSA